MPSSDERASLLPPFKTGRTEGPAGYGARVNTPGPSGHQPSPVGFGGTSPLDDEGAPRLVSSLSSMGDLGRARGLFVVKRIPGRLMSLASFDRLAARKPLKNDVFRCGNPVLVRSLISNKTKSRSKSKSKKEDQAAHANRQNSNARALTGAGAKDDN